MKRYVHATADRGDALIGIYWYTDDCRIIGLSEPVDRGILDGPYLQYSGKNHLQAWTEVVCDNFSEEDQRALIAKGFKSLYRGRCIYSTMTTTFEITCSSDLVDNEEFRRKAREYFQLTNCRVEFVPLRHYASKIELTGNPSVDAYYFDQ